MEDGVVTIGLNMDTKGFDYQIAKLERDLEVLDKTYKAIKEGKPFEGQEESLKKVQIRAEKVRNKLVDLRAKQKQLNDNGMSGFNSGISDAIKKVSKLGLTFLGIRSIFAMIRKATSTYLSQNEETTRKMNAIWIALGNAIGPIIERIADGILKVVGYLNVFVQALTNGKVDLTKNMNKNTNSINKTAAAMKALNSQVTSFDEMNKLSDTTSSGASSGLDMSGFKMPELDPTIVQKLQDMAKWIRENKELLEILGVTFGVVFGAAKIAKLVGNLAPLAKALGEGSGILGTLGKIGVIGGSIVITGYVASKLKQEVGELKNNLSELAKSGLDTVDEWLEKGQDLDTLLMTNNTHRHYNNELLEEADSWYNKILGISGTLLDNQIINSQQEQKILEGAMKIYEQGELEEDQKQRILDNLLKQIEFNDKLIEKLKEEGKPYDSIIANNKTLKDYTQQILLDTANTKEKLEGIDDINLDKKTLTVDVETNTKSAENNLLSFVRRMTGSNGPLGKLVNYGLKIMGTSTGGFRAKGGIYYPSGTPRLAVGGIVNMPGTGIPYGGAYIGERGPEAVVPLTDSQQMSMLGRAIGENVNVVATIPVYVGNRQVAREIRNINAESDFASNR